MSKVSLFVALAAFSFASSAQAATYIITLNPTRLLDSTVTVSSKTLKDNINLNRADLTGDAGITKISDPGEYLAPAGLSAKGKDSKYLYVDGENGSSAEFKLDTKSFGLTWGSIDTYNLLTLTAKESKGNPKGRTDTIHITGTDLLTLLAPYLGSLMPNGTKNGANSGVQADILFVDPYGKFKGAVLTSTQNAFEAAHFSNSVVPLPPALLLFGAGFMAFAGRAYKKARA